MSAKQAINDVLQGSVATCGRCGEVANNQINIGLLLSLWVKKVKIGEYFAKLQTRTWLSHAFCAPGQHTAKRRRKSTTPERDTGRAACALHELEAGWSARDELRARRVVVPRLDQGGEAELHVGNPLLDRSWFLADRTIRYDTIRDAILTCARKPT